MILAVCYKDGNIFQHYGETKGFMLYEIIDNKIVSNKLLESGEYSHKTLATLLKNNNVDALICGNLGTHAVQTLTSCGIEILNGNSGSVDEAVYKYIKGDLSFNPSATHECHH